MRRYGLRAAAVLLLLCIVACAARCDEYTDALRGADKRLETPVTVMAPRILLGALLDDLAKQSGVDVKIAERDEASGVQLTVYCDKIALGDLMSALHSLVSYRPALWKWERGGKAGGYVYELIQPVNAKSYPARLKQQANDVFQAHAALMLAMARMTPQERKKNVDKLAASMLDKDSKQAGFMIDNTWIWASLNVFSEALSSGVQKQALSGATADIPLDNMQPKARSAFDAAWVALNPKDVAPDGTRTPCPKPTKIQFHGSQSPRKQLARMLLMDIGDVGAIGILGGFQLEPGLHRSLREQWMLPGDSVNSDLSQQVCRARQAEEPLLALPVAPADPAAAPLPGKLPPLDFALPLIHLRLGELARSAPLPLIALLPDDVVFDIGLPYGQTVQAILDRATAGRGELMYKWRHNMLLVSYPTWFLNDEGKLPYAVVKELHRAEEDGFVPTRPLADACVRMTTGQWVVLCATTPALEEMQGARDLLIFCAQNRGVTRPGGVPLTDEVKDTLRHVLFPSDTRVMDTENAMALREVPVRRTQDAYRLYEMQFQFQGADRKWRPFMGYVQKRLLADEALPKAATDIR